MSGAGTVAPGAGVGSSGHAGEQAGGLPMQALVGWALDEDMVYVVLAPSDVSRPPYSAFGFREAAGSLLRLEL